MIRCIATILAVCLSHAASAKGKEVPFEFIDWRDFPETAASQATKACALAERGAVVGQEGESWFWIGRWHCGAMSEVSVCATADCAAPASGSVVPSPDHAPDTFQSLVAWQPPEGGRHVLAVKRVGQGGIPSVTRYSAPGGSLRVETLIGWEDVRAVAQQQLPAHQTLGSNGGRISVNGGQLVLIFGIYRAGDPNCCPNGGEARVWVRVVGRRLVFERLDHLPSETRTAYIR